MKMNFGLEIIVVDNDKSFLGNFKINIVIIIIENNIETIDKIEKTLFNKSVSVSFIIIE